MIGKIGKGKGFAGLTKYILEKEKAELLVTNLAGETPQDYYRQLSATRQLNPRVQSPVSHISISVAPGEKPPTEQLEQIVEGTLLGMGFDKNLYFAATHSDRDHFHLHIAASRINQDGECVCDRWDKRRLEKVLRNLEQQFDLTPVPCSWKVNRAAPSTGQKRRIMREQKEYLEGKRDTPPQRPVIDKIQDAIEDVIARSDDFTNYVQTLETKGVQVGALITREGVVNGLSYEMEGVRFQASLLGHTQKPTLTGLQKQGVSFDLERDARMVAKIAYSNKQKDNRSPLTIEKLIKANLANKTLAIPSDKLVMEELQLPLPSLFPQESLDPILTLYWNELEPLIAANSPLANAASVERELWEKRMLLTAIEQLEKANISTEPDFEIAMIGEVYCAIRHHPSSILAIGSVTVPRAIAERKNGVGSNESKIGFTPTSIFQFATSPQTITEGHIRYAAQKGQAAKLCNFTDEEKQSFLQVENSSQPKQQQGQQLEFQ